MLHAYLSTHEYAMYRLYMLILAVVAQVRRMCDMQGSIRLHVDIYIYAAFYRSETENLCICQAYAKSKKFAKNSLHAVSTQ